VEKAIRDTGRQGNSNKGETEVGGKKKRGRTLESRKKRKKDSTIPRELLGILKAYNRKRR